VADSDLTGGRHWLRWKEEELGPLGVLFTSPQEMVVTKTMAEKGRECEAKRLSNEFWSNYVGFCYIYWLLRKLALAF
jgi:hypothetical protein